MKEKNSVLGLYCVSERVDMVQRLCMNLLTSSRIPEVVVIVSPTTIHMSSKTKLRQLSRDYANLGKYLKFVNCSKKDGLSARRNIALDYLRTLDVELAIMSDDDIIFEPYSIERLENTLLLHSDQFAAAPQMRYPFNRSFVGTNIEDRRVGWVEEGTWKWGGFLQGAYSEPREAPVPIEHAAAVFMHKLTEKNYDIEYDRPVYFMYDSDFIYGEHVVLVPSAVVHHWPPSSGNLKDQRTDNMHHIEENIRYFAKKHMNEEVQEIDWSGYSNELMKVERV